MNDDRETLATAVATAIEQMPTPFALDDEGRPLGVGSDGYEVARRNAMVVARLAILAAVAQGTYMGIAQGAAPTPASPRPVEDER